MVKNAYRSGRLKEYKTIEILKPQFHLVTRMAGSHSPVDVIAIGPKDDRPYIVLLIQVKYGSGKLSKKDKETLIQLQQNLRVGVQIEAWHFAKHAAKPSIWAVP